MVFLRLVHPGDLVNPRLVIPLEVVLDRAHIRGRARVRLRPRLREVPDPICQGPGDVPKIHKATGTDVCLQ